VRRQLSKLPTDDVNQTSFKPIKLTHTTPETTKEISKRSRLGSSSKPGCDHCQHVLQLSVEHEIDRLRGEFRAKERDLMEMMVSRVNQIGMLEHKIGHLSKMF
jgi:hypothetical protein